jgi:cysteine desulfuration protein SufE
MNLRNRVSAIVDRFSQFDDWEDRYKEIIKIGKNLSELDDGDKIEKFQVKGCQSQVWLKPSFENGIVNYFGDSDAILVKGIVGVLIEAYSGSTPNEILEYQDDFLKSIGITDHLSMNRTNGLASMLKQIKMYAVVYKSLADKGIKDAPNL